VKLSTMGEVRMPGRHHLAHAAAGHDLADLHAGGVVPALADRPAHVGINRRVMGAHQQLAGAGPLDRPLGEASCPPPACRPDGWREPTAG